MNNEKHAHIYCNSQQPYQGLVAFTSDKDNLDIEYWATGNSHKFRDS